jgi:hypothetical protein
MEKAHSDDNRPDSKQKLIFFCRRTQTFTSTKGHHNGKAQEIIVSEKRMDQSNLVLCKGHRSGSEGFSFENKANTKVGTVSSLNFNVFASNFQNRRKSDEESASRKEKLI